VRDIVIPGIVITGELGRSIKAFDFRAQCADRTFMLRLPLDSEPGPSRDLVFRAFRSAMIALARARHATIPAVLEMGMADGRPYALLEHAEGETLAERLRWGPLPEASILVLGQHILGGLREAHRCGLVHGHLTPAEIVLLDGYRDIRIVGFGSPSDGGETRDYRSDLAALGRVLYECASGRSAFAGLSEDRHGALTEMPELSRGNEPLTSLELSALVARLLRSESPEAHIDVDSLFQDFERLEVGAPLGHAARPLPECLGSGAPEDVSFVGRGREQMHGRITVDSAVGQGTVFHMYFPRATTHPASVEAEETLESYRPAEPERGPSHMARRPDTILLVDDERLILTALERGLVREGYRVIAALTGEKAIELVTHGGPKIDVIVTDVLMPGTTGPQLVEHLVAMGIRAPHLFISGFTDGAVVPEHLLKGGGLLVKPFAIRELVDRIRQMLGDGTHAVTSS
jgi:CheY-like chemotaxis protein